MRGIAGGAWARSAPGACCRRRKYMGCYPGLPVAHKAGPMCLQFLSGSLYIGGMRRLRGSWAAMVMVVALMPRPGWAVNTPPYLSVEPRFGPIVPPLLAALNPRPSRAAVAPATPPSARGASLILKPDLGSCKEFADACREGGIVSPSPTHPLQTFGAGLGLRVGAVRFEYARGLRTGVNFIGIRTRFP